MAGEYFWKRSCMSNKQSINKWRSSQWISYVTFIVCDTKTLCLLSKECWTYAWRQNSLYWFLQSYECSFFEYCYFLSLDDYKKPLILCIHKWKLGINQTTVNDMHIKTSLMPVCYKNKLSMFMFFGRIICCSYFSSHQKCLCWTTQVSTKLSWIHVSWSYLFKYYVGCIAKNCMCICICFKSWRNISSIYKTSEMTLTIKVVKKLLISFHNRWLSCCLSAEIHLFTKVQ